jgi:hypothetical protein
MIVQDMYSHLCHDVFCEFTDPVFHTNLLSRFGDRLYRLAISVFRKVMEVATNLK